MAKAYTTRGWKKIFWSISTCVCLLSIVRLILWTLYGFPTVDFVILRIGLLVGIFLWIVE